MSILPSKIGADTNVPKMKYIYFVRLAGEFASQDIVERRW